MSLSAATSTPMPRANTRRADKPSALPTLISNLKKADAAETAAIDLRDDAQFALTKAMPAVAGVQFGKSNAIRLYVNNELASEHPATPHVFRTHEEITRCLASEPIAVLEELHAALQLQIDEAGKQVAPELFDAARVTAEEREKASEAFSAAQEAIVNFKPRSLSELSDYLDFVGGAKGGFDCSELDCRKIMRRIGKALRNGGLR